MSLTARQEAVVFVWLVWAASDMWGVAQWWWRGYGLRLSNLPSVCVCVCVCVCACACVCVCVCVFVYVCV